jgi:hypothetical protein
MSWAFVYIASFVASHSCTVDSSVDGFSERISE